MSSTATSPPAAHPAPAAGFPPRGVAVVLGTRPELIKLSTLLRLLGPAARIVHTGQHFDPALTDVLPDPPTPPILAQLHIGGQHRGLQIGQTLTELTRQWTADPPAAVIVHGDTNAALAGALAANACHIPLVHVEAGLRSRDRRMPEEHNRVIVDHLADLCCAATPGNVTNLLAENIPADRITLTGNTIVEVLATTRRDHAQAHSILTDIGAQTFILATLHRPENVDAPGRLQRILGCLADIAPPVLLSLHPRTRRRVRQLHLHRHLNRLHVTAPPDYPAFLALAERADLLISDSGGIHEEASVLKKPLLVLRRSTERPEVLGVFAELIPEPEQLPIHAASMLRGPHRDLAGHPSPFGDAHASHRIMAALTQMLTPTYTDSRPDRPPPLHTGTEHGCD